MSTVYEKTPIKNIHYIVHHTIDIKSKISVSTEKITCIR